MAGTLGIHIPSLKNPSPHTQEPDRILTPFSLKTISEKIHGSYRTCHEKIMHELLHCFIHLINGSLRGFLIRLILLVGSLVVIVFIIFFAYPQQTRSVGNLNIIKGKFVYHADYGSSPVVHPHVIAFHVPAVMIENRTLCFPQFRLLMYHVMIYALAVTLEQYLLPRNRDRHRNPLKHGQYIPVKLRHRKYEAFNLLHRHINRQQIK